MQGFQEENGVREAIESLESEKKMLEKNPNMELSENTKIIRQRWFKEQTRMRYLESKNLDLIVGDRA